jgi:hypothetical protein
MAQDYSRRHGLVLADEEFIECGVSAWKGKQRERGPLGALLKVATVGDTFLNEDANRWSCSCEGSALSGVVLSGSMW